MPVYKYCDINISSNIDLPELVLSECVVAAIRFRFNPESGSIPPDYHWFYSHSSQGDDTFLKIAKEHGAYIFRHENSLDFIVDDRSSVIECLEYKRLPGETIRHLLLDQILPRLLSHQGRLMLHASAVLTPRGAIAFLGETGWGKSTLAGCLNRMNNTLLTDDCLAVEIRESGVFCIPAYTGLRLFPDSLDYLFPDSPAQTEFAHYSVKKRLQFREAGNQYSHMYYPLVALFVLTDPAGMSPQHGISIERISPTDGLMALIRNSFKMDVTDRSETAQSFTEFGVLARKLPVFSLNYPRLHSYLPAVGKSVLKEIDFMVMPA